MKSATRSTLRYGAIGAASLVLIAAVLIFALSLIDWNTFKGPIERAASARFGRAITISGPIQARIWSAAPSVTLSGLTIGGPPWEPAPPLARIERVRIELKPLALLWGRLELRRLELIDPEVYIHEGKSGRANWSFENQAPTSAQAANPPILPPLRGLRIQAGRLLLIDELHGLKVEGSLEAGESASPTDPTPFRIEGRGMINGGSFSLRVAGGSLNGVSPAHPYPFALAITAGENQIHAEGKVLKPFDLAAVELQVGARGRDLAELYYLTRIALPNSPPFSLSAHIARDGSRIAVREIAGTLGQSDVSGRVDIDASTRRPLVRADLVSRRLLLRDLAAITGAKAEAGAPLETAHTAASAKPPASHRAAVASAQEPPDAPQLFPDAHLQADRLRAVDADVHFRATSVEAGTVPFTELSLHARLEDGVLALTPVVFDMAQGQLAGEVRIDARVSPPNVHAELRAAAVQLSQFKSQGAETPPLDGPLEARAVIDGRGDSVHNLMSAASGRITAVVPSGNVRSEFAELTGVDVAKGMGLLLRGSDTRASIRCGVAQFELSAGTAHVQDLVLDTQNVLITGNGRIFLGPEKLDLNLEGQPKKARLLRVRSPVEMRGQLLRPVFRLEAGHVLKQGAIATALGALLTPPAAVLAFVDPGLAKNEDCQQLLEQARKTTAAGNSAAARVSTGVGGVASPRGFEPLLPP